MKDFYFSHAINAANDEKILKLRAKFGNAEAYGIWWMLIEHMARNDGYVDSEDAGAFSMGYGLPIERVKEFITYCEAIGLLKKNSRGLYSQRLNDHLKFRADLSEAGKKGAQMRWGSQNDNNSPPISTPSSLPYAKERKGKEKKVNSLGKIEENKKNTLSNEETEKQYYALIVAQQWCDQHYADKTNVQVHELRTERREEVFRKMRVALNSAKHPATLPLAKKIYHEIAGNVNDFGEMERRIDVKELAKRQESPDDLIDNNEVF